MINDLVRTDWASLGHAYGAADDVPGWLRGMVSPDPAVHEEAFGNFYSAALHQGSMYSSTVASLPFLFAMADDPATPDRGEVVALLLRIGREAVDAEEIYAVICGEDGEESTIYPDTARLMREHADAFVAYAGDPDPRVRWPSVEGLGLFLDDHPAGAEQDTRGVDQLRVHPDLVSASGRFSRSSYVSSGKGQALLVAERLTDRRRRLAWA
ncbi:hypothetical protein [Streptomyces sp. NPDC051079]|uniref:hypothetical protein n=1 Tax=Streptomyces sp. NPDC051079 TaxID=3155043 RepID=UPI00344B7731